MPESKLEGYKKFIAAATSGDATTARRYVAGGFRATLHDTLAADLTFRELMDDLARQREAFSALGKNIQIVDVQEEDNRLAVTYTMAVVFDGHLRSRDGKRAVPPTNKQVNIPSQARVEYNDAGKITVLEVVTDMGHTIQQMF